MNRSRQPLFDKLRKSMSKAIKNARNTLLSAASLKERDTLTAKELQKRFPKKRSRKQENLAKALQRKPQKSKSHLGQSKRTTPGTVENQSSPAYAHREGLRQIQNSNKKIRDQRTIAAHHGGFRK